MTTQRKARTSWFARRGIHAAQFYVRLLPDGRIAVHGANPKKKGASSA